MKKAINILMLVVMAFVQFGCDVCHNSACLVNTIFTYKEGMEYPEKMHFYKDAMFATSGQFPDGYSIYRIDSNYYFSNGSSFFNYPEKIIVMSFTREELQSGLVPSDWLSHWEDFVIAENPFEQCCYLPIVEFCHKYPYYNQNSYETNNLDTIIFKQMFYSGEIWDYTICERDTSIVKKEVLP